ncbi:MAG: CDF family Co(II)/Ni(II) efflux transporter DmeF [Pseudomonadota bacterium]
MNLTADQLKHSHSFDQGNPLAEKNALRVAILTAAMMVIEIAGGWYYNSMALLADGWHMSSHTVALGVTVLAYVCARKFAHDPRFSFGTWKIEILGGYTSAILLVTVAGLMIFQSIERLLTPSPIHYNQAIGIAVAGLLVNLLSAWLLRAGHHHDHDHDHDHNHAHDHGHHDLNLRSAYLHVLADAATSILAILALFGGKLFGAAWLDPATGLIGAVVVLAWAYTLLRDTGRVLLDAEMAAPIVQEVQQVIAASPVAAQICDLHVWRVGKRQYACILSLVTHGDVTPEYFKQQLRVHEELVHISIEITRIG